MSECFAQGLLRKSVPQLEQSLCSASTERAVLVLHPKRENAVEVAQSVWLPRWLLAQLQYRALRGLLALMQGRFMSK